MISNNMPILGLLLYTFVRLVIFYCVETQDIFLLLYITKIKNDLDSLLSFM